MNQLTVAPPYHPGPPGHPGFPGQHAHTAPTDFDGINLQFFRLIWFLRRRKWLIGGVALGVMLIILAVMATIKPPYMAEATILIDPKRENVAKLEGGQTPQDMAQITETAVLNAIQTLNAPRFARELIDKLDLREDPVFNPLLVTSHGPIWAALHPLVMEYHDSLPPIFRSFLVPRFAPELMPNVDDLIVAKVASKLVINRSGKSQEVRVGFINPKPDRAAELANTYVQLFTDEQVQWKKADVHDLSAWSNERIAELRERLRVAEEKVENYRRDHELIQGRESTSAQAITDMNAQLSAAIAAREEAINKLQQAQTGTVTEMTGSLTIQALRAQEATAQSNLAAVSANGMGEHLPRVVQAKEALAAVHSKIGAEVGRIQEALRRSVAEKTRQVDSLRLQLAKAKAAGATENLASLPLKVLERDATDAKTLLDQFLQHNKQTTERDVQFGEARIVSDALVPSTTHFPNLMIILFVEMLASLGVGTTTALWVDHRNKGFRSMDEILPELAVPALSLIPWAAQPTLLPRTKPWSAYVESLRQLYAALSHETIKGSILFTSAVAQEGKTTVAVSFARTLAMGNRRVVIVDCDMRQPGVHKALGMPNGVGLADYLTGESDDADLIQTDPETGLHFMSAGKAIENPAFSLDSDRMGNLIKLLTSHYDIVVLDSPPILPVSDTKLLARYADKAVIVVRWRQTDRSMVRFAMGLLKRVTIVGVVINGVVARKHALYGMSDSGLYWSRPDRKYYINRQGPAAAPKPTPTPKLSVAAQGSGPRVDTAEAAEDAARIMFQVHNRDG